MTTITLPPDLEGRLSDEARRLGTTPESLALDGLRKLFSSPPVENGAHDDGTLFDCLTGLIGTIEGSSEPFSENGGKRFAEGLSEKQQRGRQ